MDSHYLIDTEILYMLERFPDLALTREVLPALRTQMRTLFENASVESSFPVETKEYMIPREVGASELRIISCRPENTTRLLPAILQIHGGGFILGSADMMMMHNRELADDLGCAIFAVDYRLAPDSPHPGPVEDCYAALKWMFDNAPLLEIDPVRIGVKGESAGGGLAAGLALLARDRGKVALAFQHLIYPMIDDRTVNNAQPHPYTGEFVWTHDANHFGWSCLLNEEPGSVGISEYAAAARAENLTGLPQTFIAVGALDLFLEEDMDYARRLTRAGVATELHVYPGAFHGFNSYPSSIHSTSQTQNSRVSTAMERDSREALRRAMHG